jgi:adenine phosphoribosyltransferase
MEYYSLTIGKLVRKLPIVNIGKNLKVASFNLLGDRELVETIAPQMLEKLKDIKFDYLVGPEVKVVPLLHVMAEKLNQARYIVCRKNVHGYMVLPLKSNIREGLVLDGQDAQLIKGKKVVVVDDVVSSGNTWEVMDDLVKKAGAEVVCHLAIIKQGETPLKTSGKVIFLGKLPVFTS